MATISRPPDGPGRPARRRRARAQPYASAVTPDEVGRYVETLPEVKRKGTESRPGWYVHDRLVARLQDQNTLVIRVPLSERESLLEAYPDSFGVPPRMEAHPQGRGLSGSRATARSSGGERSCWGDAATLSHAG